MKKIEKKSLNERLNDAIKERTRLETLVVRQERSLHNTRQRLWGVQGLVEEIMGMITVAESLEEKK